uniref:Uncharacterized protein n=1 Tax=Globisporangium ultimum (strain ATCC 200006 / CBS 805.95 / DAOM BR144) TaxID=431595 RepID=K3WG34_GLOUD
MDAEWELVERTKSLNALTLCGMSVSEMEAMKRDGNACFQQQQFADAVHKYSLVVDCCVEQQRMSRRKDGDDAHTETLQALDAMDVAVRLNRALAHIEQNEYVLAEEDCSTVIRKQKHCVKALYRRALARERLGKVQEAMEDVTALLKLEPMNPAALELQTTLTSRQYTKGQGITSLANCEVHTHSLAKEKALVSPPTAPLPGASRIELAEAAERAWKLMQEEESRLREAVQSSKPPAVPRKKKNHNAASGSRTAVVTPARLEQTENDVFKKKTNALWESLSMEEHNTVEKVYQKRRSTKASK